MPRWEYHRPQGQFFSPLQKQQVTLLLEAILPGSDTNPGATDAGAADYVDRLLAMEDATYYDIPRWRAQYTACLHLLAGAAQQKFGGRSLEALNLDEVTSLLSLLATGSLFGTPAQAWQTDFFATLRNHAIEGCFADERWGGNRANIIWQWYGYPSGPAVDFVRGSAALQNPGPFPEDPLSGNSATAANAPTEIQSSTLPAGLLQVAIQRNTQTPPGQPYDPDTISKD